VSEIGLASRLVPGSGAADEHPPEAGPGGGMRSMGSSIIMSLHDGFWTWSSHLWGISRVITQNGPRSVKDGLAKLDLTGFSRERTRPRWIGGAWQRNAPTLVMIFRTDALPVPFGVLICSVWLNRTWWKEDDHAPWR
jgi:hypothetical protein